MIFEAILLDKKQLDGDVFELTFKLLRGEKMIFHPGQYIWLILPKLDSSDSRGEQRAFSITSSCAKEDSLSILFRASDSGYKKTLLGLPAGARVRIKGPQGQTFVIGKTDPNVCCIAGGVGITPFLGILRSFDLLPYRPSTMTIVFLNASKEKIFLSDELKHLAGKNRVRLIEHTGLFDSALVSDIPQAQSAVYFICGPQGMVDDVAVTLRQSGVPEDNMRFEQYYPSAKNPILDQVLLGGKEKTKEDPDGAKEIMLGNMFTYYCLCAAVFSGAIALYYSFSGIPFSQNFIPLIAFCASFASYLAYKIFKNLNIASHGVAVFSIFLVLLALYQGIQNGSATYWLYFFPMLAFFFKGTFGGTIWTIIYIALIALVYGLSFSGLTPFRYGPMKIIMSLSSIGFVGILTFLASSLYGKLQTRLNRSNAFRGIFQSVYRFAVESSTNHMIITDTNGSIIYANRAAQKVTGYSFAEMQGNTPRLWGGNMSAEFYRELWEKKKKWRETKSHAEVKPFIGEIKNTRKNGAQYIAWTKISPIINEMGTTIGFIGTEEDITDRLKLEHNLKVKTAKAELEKIKDEATLQNIGEGIIALGTRGRIMLANKKIEEMFGYTPTDFRGKIFSEIIVEETEDGKILTGPRRHASLAYQSGETQTRDCVYRRKNGSKFLAHVTVTPIIVEKKNFGTVVVIRDITKEHAVAKAKTEFISFASHQLRTPLSSINWYAEMLLSGDAGKISKTQKEYLGEIYAGNQRMVELVNSLLDVSRIEMGTFAMENAPTNIKKLAREAVEELQPMSVAKKLTVKQQYKKLPAAFNADPKLLRIILQNILSNAIKYTPTKGRIILNIRTIEKGEVLGGKIMTEPTVAFAVSDTGNGIPKNQQDKIFSKLFRADNVRQMDTKGTGLGLYMTKSIIDHSGGKIWFESPARQLPDNSGQIAGAKNPGTVFYITFPLDGMKSTGGERKNEHLHDD